MPRSSAAWIASVIPPVAGRAAEEQRAAAGGERAPDPGRVRPSRLFAVLDWGAAALAWAAALRAAMRWWVDLVPALSLAARRAAPQARPLSGAVPLALPWQGAQLLRQRCPGRSPRAGYPL